MSTVKLFIGLAIASVAIILWAQYKQIVLQRQIIESQGVVTAQLQAGIESITHINEENRTQISALLYAQEQVQSRLIERNSEIRKLQNEVKEVRDWANQPLPDDIKRLFKLPATKGASGYSTAVQPSNSMHDAANKPRD